MSAVIELNEKKETISSNGSKVGTEKPYLISVKDYHSMVEKGILNANHKVELLDGIIYEKYTAQPYRISAKMYDRMIEAGILDENDYVELINGEIIEKMPKGKKHSYYNDVIYDIFREKLREKVYIRNQNPISLAEFTEPEPDIVLAKLPRGKYLENLPKPEDILLIVEVADSTLRLDRSTKGLAYSRADIGQYLIFNVENQTIEDYRNPSADGYQTKKIYQSGDKFTLHAFPEIEIAVEDFLQD